MKASWKLGAVFLFHWEDLLVWLGSILLFTEICVLFGLIIMLAGHFLDFSLSTLVGIV